MGNPEEAGRLEAGTVGFAPQGKQEPPQDLTHPDSLPSVVSATGYQDEAVPPPQPQNVILVMQKPAELKSVVEAYILSFPFGLVGAHQFYLRRPGFGVLYFFTFGLLGCGFLSDLFRMPLLVKECNDRLKDPYKKDKKKLHDAYVLWFPLGLFGAHHYYLGNWCWGVAYTFSFGLLGIGWLIDGIRMTFLVKEANIRLEERLGVVNELPEPKSLGTAYVLGISPLGLLGAHHYYLGRKGFGAMYTLTLGCLGTGYVLDWFRMPLLVKRVNKHLQFGDDRKKHIDDAYQAYFPLGLFGMHHFYLDRPKWGVLYLCTFGCLGVGWLIDLFRIPSLVEEYNKRVDETVIISPQSCVNMGGNTTIVVATSGDVNHRPPAYPERSVISYPQDYGAIRSPDGEISPPSYESIVNQMPGGYDPGVSPVYQPGSYNTGGTQQTGLTNPAYDNASNEQSGKPSLSEIDTK